MEKIKGIIFDLDGTLADTLPLCIKSFQLAIEEVTGIKHSEKTIIQYFGQTEEGIVKCIAPDMWKECLETYVKIYTHNHHLYPDVFDGIKDILDFLKKNNYKIAMVTGKGVHTVYITLDYFGISDYFEYVETGSNDGIIKDKCIERILNRWQIPASQAAYVGDQPSDIVYSRRAGVLPIAVTWASTTIDKKILENENPYKIFSEISEFKGWLESITENNLSNR